MQSKRVGILLVIVTWGILLPLCFAQNGTAEMGYASVSRTKFERLPVLPACMTISAVHGDPTSGAATILAKAEAGCLVPWHWHTANEQLMFFAGTGTLEMKEGPGRDIKSGDYLFLPAQQPHQFTCTATCLFYDVIDAAFDIHYVDKSGKELPTDQVLKHLPKPAPKKNE